MPEGPGRKSLLRRLVDRLALSYVEDIKWGQRGLLEAIHAIHGDLGRMHQELSEIHGRMEALEVNSRRAAEIGRQIYDEEPENRRRLWALRESEEYELAFSEAEPLVTFLVPTYTSAETLRDVALPSIVAQTYSNLEVIVVGDCAPAAAEEAVAAVGDPRISYFNRTIRGPYAEDPAKRWYAIGSPPLGEGLARARGRWIAVLGDDDAARPDHTEKLLAAARANRWEHCYGLQLINFREGEPITVGKFPPELGEWGLQSALYHSGLRFIEPELTDSIFNEPNDWSMCRRMLRCGVRTGMIDEIVVDKIETRRSSSEAWKDGVVPEVD
ncbi:MAG TPA: glycosyltransferase family A protein [Solirubrobacterales bacterium]|nr:glycosyltransferase family A protein [Solirubrobacterales bacterium]